MKLSSLFTCGLVALFATTSALAQEQTFCEGDGCIPDTLEMDFGEGYELVLPEFVAGQEVPATIATNTQTARIQGWSFAVKHNVDVLSIVADSVTTLGTIAHPDSDPTAAIAPGFDVSRAVSGGLVSAVVLSFLAETELPVGSRHAVCNVIYTVDADPGAEGTKLEFVSGEIGPDGSPPTDINFTVDGTSRLPATVIQGLIRVGGDVEICDDGEDNDGDGMVDCDDDDCVEAENCKTGPCDAPAWALYFGEVGSDEVDASAASEAPVLMRNALDAFAFQIGVKYEGGVHSFSSELGADADRVIELVITDQNGDSQTPEAGNTARAPVATDVVRGPAIADFADGDFFAVDLNPGVGGDGFTVGYVADLDDDVNRIPATVDSDDGCGSNHVLTIVFTPPTGGNFIRGDADGNGRYNVTDAVLIIQVVLGNLQEIYSCDDALDANDDGSANISDAIPVLQYMFQRGNALPNPFLECGQDTTGDKLTCVEDSPACAG